VLSLIQSVCGILYFNVITGIVVDAIVHKMSTLKQGKGQVIEEGHTVLYIYILNGVVS
jgi:hypothetical protein